MRINQNIAAFNSYRNLSMTNTVMGKSLEKLSSGFRINRAADDAAGLVISQGLRAQVSGLRQATRNAQDGISVVQTAEGALNEVHAMLDRMRTLANQSVNASNDNAARTAANNEITELKQEIGRIAQTTKFGTQNLLDGSFGATPSSATGTSATSSVTLAAADTFSLTIDGTARTVTVAAADAGAMTGEQLASYLQDQFRGALYTAGDGDLADGLTITSKVNGAGFALDIKLDGANVSAGAATIADAGSAVSFGDFQNASGSAALFQVGANKGETIAIGSVNLLALASGITGNVLTAGDAADFIEDMDAAIASVSDMRGQLGAVQNRFESTINNLQVTTENLAASESRIRDTDMALEMVSFTRHQILLQAGTAMLGQANQLPQSVLGLLR